MLVFRVREDSTRESVTVPSCHVSPRWHAPNLSRLEVIKPYILLMGIIDATRHQGCGTSVLFPGAFVERV